MNRIPLSSAWCFTVEYMLHEWSICHINYTPFSSAWCFTVEYMPREPHFVQFSVVPYSGVYAAYEPHCSIPRGALQWSICHMNNTLSSSAWCFTVEYMPHEPHFVQFSVVLYSGIYAA